jgi:TorA maturation chaperone TorD
MPIGTAMVTTTHYCEAGGPSAPGDGTLPVLMDRDALAVILDRFAGAFTALSGLLVAAPDAGRLNRLRDEEVLGDWPFQEDPDGHRGVRLMRESALAGEGEGEVRRDYNRLFFGPGPMVAPPYESVYRSEERLVFELQTRQVRAFYARFGLAAPRLNKEPDDHIGLEMGFLGVLCVRAMDAIDSGNDAELARLMAGVQSFLELHLLVWGPDCLTLAANGSQTFFYRSVATMGLGALQGARAAFLPRS